MSTTTEQSAATPSKLQAWRQALRPRVFVASYVPMGVAAASALQDGVFDLFKFVLSLVGVMCLQTTANLVNEYMDHVRGSDDLKEAGQSMALKSKLLSPEEIRNGAILATVAGSLIGLYMLWQSGPWLWAIGISGVLVAITYTAGPFPLAYHGLGEVAAGVFMGPMIVLGAYYVMDPSISAGKGLELSLLAFPIMFTTAAILHANNIRDREADAAANKRTLAVIFGLRVARLEYAVLIAACYVSQIMLVLLGLFSANDSAWMPWPTLLTLLTLPRAIQLVRTFYVETEVGPLHKAQGQTAQLHGQIGLLMVVGWLLYLAFIAVI